ncbi:MAG: NYN domain-containing protein [Limnothrix sp. RL_2_0]|nr:NYN domain-containing protein [Limnothrix sp. RL_2_0]
MADAGNFRPQVLLIDLENCPNQLKQLQQNLDNFKQIVICYAQSTAKIPLDWLTSLNQAINNDKLKLIKMPSSGKNAADFGICFFAGTLMAKLSEDTHFVIISNDTDLDHVVELLISQDRTAERVGYKPKKEQAESSELLASKLTEYCVILENRPKGRPAKKETLLNSIKSTLQIEMEVAKSVFDNLLAQNIVILSGTKITYDNQKIQAIAAQ